MDHITITAEHPLYPVGQRLRVLRPGQEPEPDTVDANRAGALVSVYHLACYGDPPPVEEKEKPARRRRQVPADVTGEEEGQDDDQPAV